jgi:hypothetical protein
MVSSFFFFNVHPLFEFLCIGIDIFLFFLVGSQMQQGTGNLAEQEIKIVGPDSSLSQVSMIIRDGKNNSNGSEFSLYLPFSDPHSF